MAEFIPQFTLMRQNAVLGPAVQAAVKRVLVSGRYVLGPETEALEGEIAAHLGARHAVACASGTDALHLAIRAAGVGPGDVVITTPFTFFATAGAVLLAGAKVEFVDIDPRTFNIDPGGLRQAMARPRQERLAAILPVHLFGRVAAIPEILALAADAGAAVIEDAAQAFGARLGDAAAGTLGASGCFSFYPTKNLGAAGEGGLVVTGDAEMARYLRLLRVHGSSRRYEHERLGWNARLDELQAAILRAKLPRVAEWNRRRREIAGEYEERLLGSGIATLPTVAANGAAVVLPERSADHVFHQYTIRARRRDELQAHLARQGIGTEIYYPIPVHRQRALGGSAGGASFPEAERAAAEVLSLPMFPELGDAEIERVTEAIGTFYRDHGIAERAPSGG